MAGGPTPRGTTGSTTPRPGRRLRRAPTSPGSWNRTACLACGGWKALDARDKAEVRRIDKVLDIVGRQIDAA